MIKANKNFTIKNSQGYTSPEFNKDTFKVYVNVGSKVSPMGTFDITGIIMEKVETTIGEETIVSYNETGATGAIFPVPNTIQNTPDLDIIAAASDVTVALLEEWNANVDFTVEL